MIILVLMELIPTAHRYDPKDSVVTPSLWDFVEGEDFRRVGIKWMRTRGTSISGNNHMYMYIYIYVYIYMYYVGIKLIHML